MRPRHALCSLAIVAAAVLPSIASAQELANGFSLDRFEPAERGSDWFVLDSLDLRGHKRHATGDVMSYGYKPLVMYDANGGEKAALVKHQIVNHIGASLTMWNFAKFGINIPTLVWQSGERGTIGNTRYESSNNATLGDIRMGADFRLMGRYGDPITAAAGLQMFVPTGDRASFTSDGTFRFIPRVAIAGDVSDFAYAARVGVAIRPQTDTFANTPMGSEMTFALAGGVRAWNKKFLFGPELWGTTGLSDGDAFFKRRTTPVEVLMSAHFKLGDDLHVDFGIGPGLTRGIGTPLFRVVSALEWHPHFEEPKPPPPPDRDRDQVLDHEDACPDIAGVRTAEPKTNGCPPPPPDRDKDGVIDTEDACIDVPGVATQDPKTNGCPPPPPDRDGDGVPDPEDACVDVAGVATQDPKTNGCPPPPPDRDGDSIIDSEDACPDHPGPKDPDPKKNGCPVARVEAGEIKITQQVLFKTGSAELLPESDGVLGAVLDILQKNAEITKISIEGHTDSKGDAWMNKDLSKRRAASVATWLAKKGIDKKRMTSAGFGKERPIDTNDTEPGRQKNRRVEFHITEKNGVPVAAPPATPGAATTPGAPATTTTPPGAAPKGPATLAPTQPGQKPGAPPASNIVPIKPPLRRPALAPPPAAGKAPAPAPAKK